MGEREEQEQKLEEFRERFQAGLADFFVYLETESNKPVPPDPYSMGVDDRTFEDLNDDEKRVASEMLLETLGLTLDTLGEKKVREYVTQTTSWPAATVPGEIQVSVCSTNREGLFLQVLVFLDGQRRWLVGPDKDI